MAEHQLPNLVSDFSGFCMVNQWMTCGDNIYREKGLIIDLNAIEGYPPWTVMGFLMISQYRKQSDTQQDCARV